MTLISFLLAVSLFLITIALIRLDKEINSLKERLKNYEKKKKNKNSEVIDI